MPSIVAIMQPSYLPYMGYMSMVDEASLFILLDTVQFQPKSWQMRNRIINSQGNEMWLSVPTHHHQGDLLENIQVDDSKEWRKKHHSSLNAITKPAGLLAIRQLQAAYNRANGRLSALTELLIKELAQLLYIRTPVVAASAYGLPKRADPLERIHDLLMHTGATEMLDTAGAETVLGTDKIGTIPVRFQQYVPEEYPQHGGDFKPFMSVVDCLARHGTMITRRAMLAGRR